MKLYRYLIVSLFVVLSISVGASRVFATAAVAIDTHAATMGNSTNITIGNNPNRLLIVFAWNSNSNIPSAVTAGGVSMTKIIDDTGSSNRAAVFELIAPATGTNLIVVTAGAGTTFYAYLSLYNVLQTMTFTVASCSLPTTCSATASVTTGGMPVGGWVASGGGTGMTTTGTNSIVTDDSVDNNSTSFLSTQAALISPASISFGLAANPNNRSGIVFAFNVPNPDVTVSTLTSILGLVWAFFLNL